MRPLGLAETRASEREVVIDKEIAKLYDVYDAANMRHAAEMRHRERNNWLGEEDEARIRGLTKIRDEALRAYREVAKKYEGWSRYYLVTNHDGHIHRSMSCSTCNRGRYRPTSFSWLTELSGLDYEVAVREYGKILCSVCFPEAPTDYTEGDNIKEIAGKERRANISALRKTAEFKAFKTKFDLVKRHAYHKESAKKSHERAVSDIERLEKDVGTRNYDDGKGVFVEVLGEVEHGDAEYLRESDRRLLARKVREKSEEASKILKAARGLDKAAPKFYGTVGPLLAILEEYDLKEYDIETNPLENYFSDYFTKLELDV